MQIKSKRVQGGLDRQDDILSLKKSSQVWEIWGRLVRNKTAMVGLIILVVLILTAIFADYIAHMAMTTKSWMTSSFHHVRSTSSARITSGAISSAAWFMAAVSPCRWGCSPWALPS